MDPRLRLTHWLWRPAWHVLDVLRPDTMQVGVGTQWGRSRVVFSLSARPWVRVDSPEDPQHAHDHRVPLAPAPVVGSSVRVKEARIPRAQRPAGHHRVGDKTTFTERVSGDEKAHEREGTPSGPSTPR